MSVSVARTEHITSLSCSLAPLFIFTLTVKQKTLLPNQLYYTGNQYIALGSFPTVSPVFYKVLERTSSVTGQQRLWMLSG